ncbi:oligosaccharide MFS transporter [Pseudonocardia spirodelae]|uniref:Oligosaccharide MFS transporter n=1 Tax=Pseudonocardia spirodelae TaxID=3133431 RepID=A0ABU8T195_9PSEU
MTVGPGGTGAGPAPLRRRNAVLAASALALFFMTWSLSWSLFAIWLTGEIGLSPGRSALVVGANSVGCLLVMPVYGFLQDRLGLRRNLLLVVGGLMVLAGPFYIHVYGPLLQHAFLAGLVVGALYLASAFAVAVATLECYVERLGRLQGFEFGPVRMWGSLGWAAATWVAGRLFTIDPRIAFWAASATAVLFVLVLLAIRVPGGGRAGAVDAAASTVSPREALGLLRNPASAGLVLYVVAVTATYGVYDSMFPSYFASLFPTAAEGTQTYATLNAVQVFLEAGGMALAPFLVNRVGPRRALLLAGAVMALRILLSGVVVDPLAISAVKLLHAVELPIMLIAVFKYVNRHFEARYSATVYLVGYQLVTQFGSAIISPLAGVGYDRLGFAHTYLLMGTVVAVFTAVSVLTLRRDGADRVAVPLRV